jgi:hypothetical protein
MKIACTSNSRKNDYANDDFITFHNVHVKNMFRTRSFNLFVNRQTRNYLRQFRLIRVAWAIIQRQRNDDTIHEDTKNRFTYYFRRFSNYFIENIKRKNARSIHLQIENDWQILFWLIRLTLTDEINTDWRGWHSLRKITFD